MPFKPKNTSAFVADARLKHGDRFNYDKVQYVNSKTVIEIVCPIHGLIRQTPYQHLTGNGCKQCGLQTRFDSARMTLEDFVFKSQKVHGYKYSYENVNYINAHTCVDIFCKNGHAVFSQRPMDHLNGKGCQKCGFDLIRNKKTNNKEEFVEKSKNIHGNKYDYKKCRYTSQKDKVVIRCPKHGDFVQVAAYHVNGNGCPRCAESKGERKVALALDKLKITYQQQCRFDSCKNKQTLPFDFKVQLDDKFFLIEFQGSHHYKPLTRGVLTHEQAIVNFRSIQANDSIKKEWCKTNDIALLEIPYWESDNIKSIINAFIEGIS